MSVGAMAWMTRSVKMQTKSGGLGGMFKKAISGESLFLNNYVAEAPGEIAFGMSFPGHILAVDVTQMPLVAQKKAFLASESTVSMDVFLQKKNRRRILRRRRIYHGKIQRQRLRLSGGRRSS